MESDRDAVVAFLEEEDSVHGPCGQPVDEAWDEENEHRYRGAAYVCFACAARDRKRDEDEKGAVGAPLYGYTWHVVDRTQEG